jgi:F0F1-type ATP synthase alpha subunit
MKKFDEDNSSNNTISRINNYPYTSRDLSKFNTGTNLEKIILKNKVNKIIKIYRNYHKKRDLNSFASTRNNTDRLQENNSLKNLLSQKNLNSPSNNNNTNNLNNNNLNNNNNNSSTIKSHSIITKNNNTCIYIGNRDSFGNKNGFGIQKWEDGSKFSCIFDSDLV